MKLWTMYLDYSATGEGRTFIANIVYAENETEAREKAIVKNGDYFGELMEIKEGLDQNNVIEFLFSEKVIEKIKTLNGVANIELHSKFHFNLS